MLDRFRHWLKPSPDPIARPAPEYRMSDSPAAAPAGTMSDESRVMSDEFAALRAHHSSLITRESSRLGRLVTSYLNAPSDELLALVLEELIRGAARELGQAVAQAGETLSGEMAGIRESTTAAQRELSRMGRELVRSGATLQSIQEAVVVISPMLEQLEVSLRTELSREQAHERQLREEAERTALEDMLATLDGLELGLEAGQDVLQALATAQHWLLDPLVARWWRAMGEVTGVECALPNVPLAQAEGWLGGLELTYRRLQDAVAQRGVTAIEALGKPFDPHLHEAVAVEPCPAEQDGLVLREQRRGYRRPDRIVRPAQVVVGRAEVMSDE